MQKEDRWIPLKVGTTEYQAAPEENETKTRLHLCLLRTGVQKGNQKYAWASVHYKPWIHYFYGMYLQHHHKISPMTGVPEGHIFYFFKVTFNQCTSTACWSHNVLQSQYACTYCSI